MQPKRKDAWVFGAWLELNPPRQKGRRSSVLKATAGTLIEGNQTEACAEHHAKRHAVFLL